MESIQYSSVATHILARRLAARRRRGSYFGVTCVLVYVWTLLFAVAFS